MSIDTSTIGLLCLASFAAGCVDAVAGGGGLITVPALLATGLPEHFVMGTNKGQAVFGATSSFVSFWRKGLVDRARALPAFASAFVGSLAGAALLLRLPREPLRPAMVVLLLAAAVLVLIPKPRARVVSDASLAHGTSLVVRASLIALACGAYDGFFGPGTGSLLIAAHMMFMGDVATRASGNAKVANLASNLAAVLMLAWRGKVLWHISLPMAVANALGAFLGARIAIGAGDRFVRYVVVTVAVALVLKVTFGL